MKDNSQIVSIGDTHFSRSTRIPLRADAFVKSDEEKAANELNTNALVV
ncbi:hypothetical protein NQT66_05645 [Cellulophaga baltica]|nr:hypothetical protein [Cellulophaga baltica]MCR1024281.1 hypothetical protein [Cellulophaga baltica]